MSAYHVWLICLIIVLGIAFGAPPWAFLAVAILAYLILEVRS